jgi:hypothetical protein
VEKDVLGVCIPDRPDGCDIVRLGLRCEWSGEVASTPRSDILALLGDPLVLAIAGGLLVLIIIGVAVVLRRK